MAALRLGMEWVTADAREYEEDTPAAYAAEAGPGVSRGERLGVWNMGRSGKVKLSVLWRFYSDGRGGPQETMPR
jgi:hypothetical protein